MTDYSVTGLALQKTALTEQLERVRTSDAFAKMLLLGKIKAVQRQLDALSPHSEGRIDRMDMVERVAMAIYEGRNGVGAIAWNHRKDGYKDQYRADARAAISAMREPTPEMRGAGTDAHSSADTVDALHCYEAMIDAALKP